MWTVGKHTLNWRWKKSIFSCLFEETVIWLPIVAKFYSKKKIFLDVFLESAINFLHLFQFTMSRKIEYSSLLQTVWMKEKICWIQILVYFSELKFLVPQRTVKDCSTVKTIFPNTSFLSVILHKLFCTIVCTILSFFWLLFVINLH